MANRFRQKILLFVWILELCRDEKQRYAVYPFTEEQNGMYSLGMIAEPETLSSSENDMYHIFMPGDHIAAGFSALECEPRNAVQILFASHFQSAYPEVVF